MAVPPTIGAMRTNTGMTLAMPSTIDAIAGPLRSWATGGGGIALTPSPTQGADDPAASALNEPTMRLAEFDVK